MAELSGLFMSTHGCWWGLNGNDEPLCLRFFLVRQTVLILIFMLFSLLPKLLGV